MRTPISPRRTGTVLALLSLSLVFTLLTVASAAEKPDAAPSAAAQYQALTREYQKEQADFSKAYGAARTDEERRKVFDTNCLQPQKYAGRLLGLAQKYPQDPVAVDALIWVATVIGFGAEADQAVGILLKDHIQSEKLGPLCLSLVYPKTPQTEQQLRDIIAKNPHAEVQGQATFSLAKILQNQPGKGKQAEEYFEQALNKFGRSPGNASPLANQAKAELFEIRALGIGKTAPEIEGQDVEGKAFKLSDYRGKVVLIDFWGDW